jgi:hypothetical protein
MREEYFENNTTYLSTIFISTELMKMFVKRQIYPCGTAEV